MLYLCFSDGTRELERRAWYRSADELHAEVMRRNASIESHGDDEAGYWYWIDDRRQMEDAIADGWADHALVDPEN